MPHNRSRDAGGDARTSEADDVCSVDLTFQIAVLRELQISPGLVQAHLAAVLGRDRSLVSRAINEGARLPIEVHHVPALIVLFGVDARCRLLEAWLGHLDVTVSPKTVGESNGHVVAHHLDATAAHGSVSHLIREATHPDSDGGAEITAREASQILPAVEAERHAVAATEETLRRASAARR